MVFQGSRSPGEAGSGMAGSGAGYPTGGSPASGGGDSMPLPGERSGWRGCVTGCNGVRQAVARPHTQRPFVSFRHGQT